MQEQEIKDETTSVETTETTISTETADKDKKVRNRIHRKPAPQKEAKATTAPADTKILNEEIKDTTVAVTAELPTEKVAIPEHKTEEPRKKMNGQLSGK